MADYVALETSGHVLLEDGTSGLLLETSPAIPTWNGSATVSLTVTITTGATSMTPGVLTLVPASLSTLTLAPSSTSGLSLVARTPDTLTLTPS